MIREGQIALFAFPQTDQAVGKLRPALVLRCSPGPHDDWLICMVSSQLGHELPWIDEIVKTTDADFTQSGLKGTSLIRVTRLAIVAGDLLQGAIGSLAPERLDRVRTRVAGWVSGSLPVSPAGGPGTADPVG